MPLLAADGFNVTGTFEGPVTLQQDSRRPLNLDELPIHFLGCNPLLPVRSPETHWVQWLDRYFAEYALGHALNASERIS